MASEPPNGANIIDIASLNICAIPLSTPVERTLPSLLDLPGPVLLCYRTETSLAEKFHAIVDFGEHNTRMKDFYDIWYVATNFSVSGHDLAAALRAVFKTQGSPLPSVPPFGLTNAFAQYKQPDWTLFRGKLQGERGPEDFPGLVKSIRAFLMPVVKAVETDPAFRRQWDVDRGRWVADHLRERDDAVPAPRKRNAGGAW